MFLESLPLDLLIRLTQILIDRPAAEGLAADSNRTADLIPLGTRAGRLKTGISPIHELNMLFAH